MNPKSNNQIYYIDMQELMPEYAFETMKRLAKNFNFTPPKEEDKEKFTQIIWGKFVYILPIVLNITKDDFSILKEDFELKICENYSKDSNLIDLKEFLLEKDTTFYNEIAILSDFKHSKIIQDNEEIKDKLKSYFKEFFKAFKYWVNFRLQNQINENQILDYFRENPKIRQKLKTICDKELSHLKAHRPDIVASWKYYNEFESMCEELDK